MRTLLSLLAVLTCALVLVLPPARPAWGYEHPMAWSLDGTWELCPAPPLVDLIADRAAKPDFPQLSPDISAVIPAQARANPQAVLPADAAWQPAQVPAAWEQVLGISYNGAGWYRLEVLVPDYLIEGDQRLWLEFDAAATAAGVWLNGEWLGGHVGDFTRWRVEATSAAHTDQNELLVYVDELPGHITQAFLSMLSPHYGGLWQGVRMYTTGPVAIRPDGVQLKPDWRTGEVEVRIAYDGAWDPGYELVCALGPYDPESESFETMYHSQHDRGFDLRVDSAACEITFHGRLRPFELWSPDHPQLYAADIEIWRPDISVLDSVRQTYAYRDIRIEGAEVLLNGAPVTIRSQLQWGMYPRIVSPAVPPDVLRREFEIVKSLGFNTETVCLIVMPDYYYDLADELGLLIWQEYPTWHNTFTANHLPTYRREFPAYLRRDRNHPSIVLRSISVEAGVEDQAVMGELYHLCKTMADTPVQDNNSWFWLSNPDTADWYGEDNYYNNDQWARHLLLRLPGQLDELPVKPYIIGETIVANPWPDTAALAAGECDLTGTDEPLPGMTRPYWYPWCFDSCLAIEAALRARYNAGLPAGRDIVRDYLLPQSDQAAMAYRRFQIELMHADPRYKGYTLNHVRDVQALRGGLIDYVGAERYTTAQWAWHGPETTSPVTTAEVRALPAPSAGEPDRRFDKLLKWDPAWDGAIDRSVPILALSEGYRDLTPLLAGWDNVRWIAPGDLNPARAMEAPTLHSQVVLTTVLTHELVDFVARGGAVILLTSKWPGALGSYPHFFWRDAVFVPPVGPWQDGDPDRLIQLQQYDLIQNLSQVIPVKALGLMDNVDPLLRLFDTHDLIEVDVNDQLFATNIGEGLFCATSLDHSTQAGQWVLGKLASFAAQWTNLGALREFPVTSLEPERLHELAVERANGIIGLDDGWRFALDQAQQGERLGYMRPDFDDRGWDAARTGVSWEALGYSYDGMGWYRRAIDVPANWAGGKIRLVADGVDDAYTVWVNGVAVATHGSFTDHDKTIWLKQTVTDLTGYLKPGEVNTLVLQVVDITGQGGVYKPLYLTVE